jgi:hypothetical protein
LKLLSMPTSEYQKHPCGKAYCLIMPSKPHDHATIRQAGRHAVKKAVV